MGYRKCSVCRYPPEAFGPQRHQRKRQSGYSLPADVVCVTRPGLFGNPFDSYAEFKFWMGVVVQDGFQLELLHPYLPVAPDDSRCLLSHRLEKMKRIADSIEELRGKDLACWCSLEKPCHADVLLEYANSPLVKNVE